MPLKPRAVGPTQSRMRPNLRIQRCVKQNKMWRAMLLAVLLPLIGAHAIQACSCLQIGPDGTPEAKHAFNPEAALRYATAIFRGKVIAIRELELPAERALRWAGSMRVRLIMFQVSDVWKGVDFDRVIGFTGNGGPDCSFEFAIGKEYLVFAQRDGLFVPDELNFTWCSDTELVSSASEKIKLLGLPERQFK